MVTAIILAGGLGTRLRGVVPDLPKPMAAINGRPFLEYQIDYWISQGVRRFILSVGYRREIIMDHFGSSYRGRPVGYAIEEHPLGTGGGLLLAMESLGGNEPVLLLNGDTFFEVDLDQMLEFHVRSKSDWTFSLFHTNESGRYMGMDLGPEGRIRSLRTDDRQGGFANGGVYLVERGLVARTRWCAGDKASLEDEILPAMFAAGGRFFGYVSHGRFIDIGVPDDYFRAAEILLNQ